MAEGAEGDLTDFHERQLVHALGVELDARHQGLWTAFEYGYLNNNDDWMIGMPISVLALSLFGPGLRSSQQA